MAGNTNCIDRRIHGDDLLPQQLAWPPTGSLSIIPRLLRFFPRRRFHALAPTAHRSAHLSGSRRVRSLCPGHPCHGRNEHTEDATFRGRLSRRRGRSVGRAGASYWRPPHTIHELEMDILAQVCYSRPLHLLYPLTRLKTKTCVRFVLAQY